MNKAKRFIVALMALMAMFLISTIGTVAASEKKIDVADSNNCNITISNFIEEKNIDNYKLYVAASPVIVKFNGDGLSAEYVTYMPDAKIENGSYKHAYGDDDENVQFDVKKCYYFEKSEIVDENPECADMPTYITGNYCTLSKPGYYWVWAAPEAVAGTSFILQVTDGNASANNPETLKAAPTTSKVLINGKEISFEAYNIKDNNYFKLRDLAMALNGTAKNFDVGWDADNNAISLISGKEYMIVGNELTKSAKPTVKEVNPSTSKILLDGKEVVLTAYNIGGNNYFKLRDIANSLNVAVTWDAKTSTINIDTNNAY